MKPSPQRLAPWIVIVLVQASLVGLAAVRLLLTRQSVLGLDECLDCQATTLVQHEAGLWALIWAALLAMTARWWPLRVAATAALWVLLMLLAADLVILQQFGLRLYLADVFKFGQQPRFIVEYLDGLLGWWWIPALLLLAGALPWLTVLAARRLLSTWAARAGLALMCIGSGVIHLLPDRTAHPLPWTYQNLLEANWPSSVDRRFSVAYRQDLLAHPPPTLRAEVCEEGLDRGGDVIVVAVESLSWYHSSLLLPRALGATPHLDALARDNVWWDHYLANGFTTDHGLIAMLAGQLPVPAINRYRSRDIFAGYAGDERALPRRLAAAGYYSAFLTSGHLGFLGKGDWLSTLGFDHIEGHDQAEYEGARRYAFAAVSDDLLYRRVIHWLTRERPTAQPVFAFVETVSTHPPFTVPGSGENDETGAFEFADRALADFVGQLDDLGFFREGLLIVTSDQRALTPLRASEVAAFGATAGARLPLVMKGDRLSLSGRQTVTAQMLDLPASLDWYLTEEACMRPGQGNLFTGQAPDCVFQPDGDERDVIRAFCGEHEARILLDGDDTRVVEGELPDAERRLRELNYLRARLGVQEANMHLVL